VSGIAVAVMAAAGIVGGRGLIGDTPRVTARASASPTGEPTVDDGGSYDGVPSAAPLRSTVSPEPGTSPWSPPLAPVADGGTEFVPTAGPASTPVPAARPVGDRVTARYTLVSTWDGGFIVRITVQNPTAEAAAWRVVVAYPKAASVTVTRAWGATVTGPGHRLSIRGGPLAPGKSTSFKFQADKDQPGGLRPDACTVNGAACTGL
jgi:cellulase/cellobiase CelA1